MEALKTTNLGLTWEKESIYLYEIKVSWATSVRELCCVVSGVTYRISVFSVLGSTWFFGLWDAFLHPPERRTGGWAAVVEWGWFAPGWWLLIKYRSTNPPETDKPTINHHQNNTGVWVHKIPLESCKGFNFCYWKRLWYQGYGLGKD